MGNIDIRKQKGNQLEQTIVKLFDSNGVIYTHYDIENLMSYSEIMNLRRSNDAESLKKRYHPDFIVYLNDEKHYLEVKSSSGFPKHQYDHLMANYDLSTLWICNRHLEIALLKDVLFEIPLQHEKVARLDVPIIDKYWRSPDLLDDIGKTQYIENHKKKNGYSPSLSPFAFIDFNNTQWIHINKWIKL